MILFIAHPHSCYRLTKGRIVEGIAKRDPKGHRCLIKETDSGADGDWNYMCAMDLETGEIFYEEGNLIPMWAKDPLLRALKLEEWKQKKNNKRKAKQ